MWVLTIFVEDTFRIYEFETKEEAVKALQETTFPAIVTFTNLTLVA